MKHLNHVFEYAPIDFTNKRLPLENNPRIQSTVKSNASFNSFGKALLKLRRSFIPKGDK